MSETTEEFPTMANEMTALDVLQGQVTGLTTQLQKLTSERDEYRDALSEISKERDSLKSQVAAPDAQAARISELEASIRDRQHYDKFAELAKAARAKDKALKQLWRDAKDRGYEPESDEIDEKALQAAVASLKTEVDYAFEPDETSTTKTAQEAARTSSRTKYGLDMADQPPAGGGRANRNQGGDGTIVTAEMRADPKFMLDPRNREIITAAAKEGRFR